MEASHDDRPPPARPAPLAPAPPAPVPVARPIVLDYLTPRTQRRSAEGGAWKVGDLILGFVTVAATVVVNLLLMVVWDLQMADQGDAGGIVAAVGVAEAAASM